MKVQGRTHYFLKLISMLSVFSFVCTGCDLLLRILQKELAEEKELLGDTYTYNPKVEKIQKILKEAGYSPGPIDGRLGSKTRGAIKLFQKDHNLKITGYVDKETWRELNEIQRELTIFFQKINVREIQSALKKAGFNPGPIDGKIGPKTRKAIREFQKAKGLTPNGIVGYKTWSMLKKFMVKE